MAKFHINPDTGEVGQCRAIFKCRFKITDSQHYSSEQEARTAYEKTQKIFNNKGIKNFQHKTKPISKTPHWYEKESLKYKKNGSSLEILGELDINGRKVTSTFSQTSNDVKDKDIIKNSGFNIQKYELYDSETGENIGSLKVSGLDKKSIERSFGPINDYLTPLRYRTKYSNGILNVLNDSSDPDFSYKLIRNKKEKQKILEKLWTEVLEDSSKNGIILPTLKKERYFFDKNSEIPSPPKNIDDLEKDLKYYSKFIKMEMENQIRNNTGVSVINFKGSNKKNNDIEAELYSAASIDLAKKGKFLKIDKNIIDNKKNLKSSLKENKVPIQKIDLYDKPLNDLNLQDDVLITNEYYSIDYRGILN